MTPVTFAEVKQAANACLLRVFTGGTESVHVVQAAVGVVLSPEPEQQRAIETYVATIEAKR